MAGILLPSEGWEEAVGVGKESTYATGVAATFWLRNASISLKKADPVIPLAGTPGVPWELLYHATRPRSRLGPPQVQGDIVFEVEADDIGFFLEQLYGAGTFTTDGGGDTGAHLHEFAGPRNPTQMPDSFSIIRLTGGQSYRYLGCVLTQLVFRAQPNQIIRCTASFVAREAAKISASVGTFSSAPWLEFYASQFRYDAVGTTPDSSDAIQGRDALDSWTMTLPRPLLVRQRAGDNTRGIAEPILNNAFSALLEMVKDHVDSTFQDIYLNTAIASRARYAALFCDSNELIAGSTNYSMEFRQPAGLFEGDTGEYGGGFGVVPETVMVKSQDDGTNAPITVRLVNTTGSGSYSS